MLIESPHVVQLRNSLYHTVHAIGLIVIFTPILPLNHTCTEICTQVVLAEYEGDPEVRGNIMAGSTVF